MGESMLDKIHTSFEIQAKNFENSSMSFSKKEYLEHTVELMELSKKDSVLEVAAGTCACGRSVAPHVAAVTCLDTTEAMLQTGRDMAQKEGLCNMVFVKGEAEALPFLDNSFDVVLSRLAFHHFLNPSLVFCEMVRVLRPGGKIVIIDMEAAEEVLRQKEDALETLRDPSHVKNLSKEELLGFLKQAGLTVLFSESTKIQVSFSAWLALTNTPQKVSSEITAQMLEELQGGEKTGFNPFLKEEELFFEQRWLMVMGRKESAK